MLVSVNHKLYKLYLKKHGKEFYKKYKISIRKTFVYQLIRVSLSMHQFVNEIKKSFRKILCFISFHNWKIKKYDISSTTDRYSRYIKMQVCIYCDKHKEAN